MSKFFVSRQMYFGVDPEDCFMVEIAEGGLDYSGSDMLCSKYAGEGEEYSDPREAVKVAISIAEQWQKDKPEEKINIGEGYTCGMTMPFEGSEKEDLIQWAEDRYSKMEKCPACGEITEDLKEWWGSGSFRHGEFMPNNDGEKYCSESCRDKASTYDCDGADCDTYYFYEDRNKLEWVESESLCPDCCAVICAVCGMRRDDHNQEEHDFEPTEETL